MLRLTYACEDYDLQRAIIDGTIRPPGVEIAARIVDSYERHERMARHQEYDLAEFSMSTYMAARASGDSLVALPVFPRRMFVHRYMFVSAAAGIREPRDLEGKRVGIARHFNTLSLVARGLLHDQYGVDLSSIHWITQMPETMAAPAGPGLPTAPGRFEAAPTGRKLEDMLVAGEIDAMMVPEVVGAWERRDPRMRRLFPDFKAAEQESFGRTGIFPIMHVLVGRADVFARHPELPALLVDAFGAAQTHAFARIATPALVSLVWAQAALEEQQAFFGGFPWPLGLAANADNLRTMVRWAQLLGLTPRLLSLEELFPFG